MKLSLIHIIVIPLTSSDTVRGVLGGIRGYTPYTNLWCFLTAYTYLVCHNKTRYTHDIRLNSEQENVHCTVTHQTAAFLSLYVLFNVQRLLVGDTIVPYILANKSQNLRQNLAQNLKELVATNRRVIK